MKQTTLFTHLHSDRKTRARSTKKIKNSSKKQSVKVSKVRKKKVLKKIAKPKKKVVKSNKVKTKKQTKNLKRTYDQRKITRKQKKQTSKRKLEILEETDEERYLLNLDDCDKTPQKVLSKNKKIEFPSQSQSFEEDIEDQSTRGFSNVQPRDFSQQSKQQQKPKPIQQNDEFSGLSLQTRSLINSLKNSHQQNGSVLNQSRNNHEFSLLNDTKNTNDYLDNLIIGTEKRLNAQMSQKDNFVKSQVDEILQKESLKDKFKHLLADIKENTYNLPYHYNDLSQIFENIDHSLFFFHLRHQTTFIDKVFKSLRKIISKDVTLLQLQQIMTVLPNGYDIKWMKNEKMRNKYQLQINFPQNFDKDGNGIKMNQASLNQRKEQFKKNLFELAKVSHDEYLQSVYKYDFNYKSSTTWFSGFNVHKIPQIMASDLPKRPGTIKTTSINQFLKEHDIQNQIVKKMMESTVQAEQDKNKKLENEKKKYSGGLSERLLRMIRAKEQCLKENQIKADLQNKKNDKTRKLQETKHVIEIMKTHYTQRRVSNMFMVQVIDQIHNSKSLSLLSQDEIMALIEFLLEAVPTWIKKMDVDGNIVLRIDKKMRTYTVFEKLEEYYSKQG